ncbi:MOSC domain-containing protein [Paraherbaspirillum soli]|uniref:MOSC domain-containing protein n=1 Tax=Paraherbaspirillum soli TaxID=631222 RepID=A0ABW0M7M4_9BURK
MTENNAVSIVTLLTGKAVPLNDSGAISGIDKHPCQAAQIVGHTGLQGDEQGDLVRHGGPEKAVHHYPYEHYASWIDVCGEIPVLSRPGAFGENISTVGMTEHNCCVGDIYRVGTALLQISQARQPCWKLNHRFGRNDMAALVQKTRLTGWYYRVLETGLIAAGDCFLLEDRPCPNWTLIKLLETLYGDATRMHKPSLVGIANLAPLSFSWRQLAQKRLERGAVEDWSPRLTGVESGAAG